LCAGFAGVQVLKILLNRGKVRACPQTLHFDGYTDKLYSQKVWFGNRNPWQRLKIAITRRALAAA